MEKKICTKFLVREINREIEKEKKMVKKIYTKFLVQEINREIKKEAEENEKINKENIFFFSKIYVIAMKNVEKKNEKHCFCKSCFCKNKFINFSDYLISLHKDVLQRVYEIHINKNYIFL